MRISNRDLYIKGHREEPYKKGTLIDSEMTAQQHEFSTSVQSQSLHREHWSMWQIRVIYAIPSWGPALQRCADVALISGECQNRLSTHWGLAQKEQVDKNQFFLIKGFIGLLPP